ncbi:hypothetical protein JCM10908_007255 [Rhodotorula pacifica]|uniref:uncharacterized protein n=1 Tax=Rhodotorula pacifica TaxID=1495444 RepID=UPI00317E73B3
MATISDWTDKAARAYGCGPALQAAFQSALQVPTNEGVAYTSEQYIATWACRFSSDSTIASEAKDLWPTLNSYGYYPSAPFAIAAMVIFSASGALHLYQLGRSRRWAFISVICAAGLEVYGWYCRYQSASDVMYGYIVQLAVLTIAPTFYAGGIYALFYALAATQVLDAMPWMRPKVFSWSIFVVEIITLSIQAAGGAIAATVSGKKQFLMGTHIMTAGTSLQLATSVFFTVFFILYYRRLSRHAGNVYSLRNNLGRIFWGTIVAEIFLIIRGAYRTAELSEGLFGKLGTTQIALILGDAVPIFIVAIMLNLIHPLWTVKRTTPAHSPLASRDRDSDNNSAEMKDYSSSRV